MKRVPRILLVACLGLLCIGGSAPDLPNGEIPPELKSLVEGNTTFAFELYSNLEDQEGNLFLSPYSISSALAIAYGGARGETEQQMAKTLHLPLDQDACHAGMAEIRKALAKADRKDEVELNVANGLWTQTGYAFRKEFVRFAEKSYGAQVESVDFLGSAGAACKRINAWIEKQTKRRIKNAVSPDMVPPTTRLVIVNAIYFKGQWASRFDKTATEPRPFWVSAAKSVETPTMSQQSEFLYGEDDLVQLLELPYKKNGLSMIIILPKERDGLAQVEKQLTPANLSTWLGGMELRLVNVLLPKFRIESRLSLAPTLAAMGMPDAFHGSRADFTGITAERPFFITGVVHAALVEVDEEGTVAAAATVTLGGCSATGEHLPFATFHADHPFLFLIRDNRTGTILFLGKVLDPTLAP